MKNHRVTFLLLTLLSAILLMAVACAPAAPPAATEAPAAEAPTEQAAGEMEAPSGSITLLIHPTLYAATGGDAPEGVVSRFREATGIDVEVVTAPSADLQERATVEYVAGSGRFDVVTWNTAWLSDENMQFFEPLEDYVAQAGEDYNFEDIIPSLLEITKFNDHLYSIPFRMGGAMLYYRTDLMEEAGLEPPKTWEDYLNAAEALTQDTDGDGEVDVYGAIQRGRSGFEIEQDFIRFLFAHGGRALSDDMTACRLNEPEGVNAVNTFVTIYQEGWAPPDMLAVGRDDYIAAMQQGSAAMSVMFSPYWGRLIDPEESPQAENMGWALVPTSPGVPEGRSMMGGWYLAMDKNSDNKAAAWALIQALTNAENQLTMALEFANGPVRSSVYENQQYLEEFPLAKDWLTAIANGLFEPPHARWAEIVDIMSEEVTSALQGDKTPQEAMDAACQRVDRLLQ